MIEKFSFIYEYKGKTKTHTLVTYGFGEALDKACVFLEGLNDNLDLIGLDSWEDIQDECEKYNIILGDLIVEDE